MNAIDKMIHGINEPLLDFEDIPNAKDVRTQSKVFNSLSYKEKREITDTWLSIEKAIINNKDYCFHYIEEDMTKFYICKVIPFLNKKGYDVIYKMIKGNYIWHRFYIIWNNYEYSHFVISQVLEDQGAVVTIFESKVKE